MNRVSLPTNLYLTCSNDSCKNNYKQKRLTSKKSLLKKLYNNKFLTKESHNTLNSVGLDIIIDDMNEKLDNRYRDVFRTFSEKNYKLFDIVLLHFKIKCIENHFDNNNFTQDEQYDLYTFLKSFNEIVDEINNYAEELKN